MSCVICKKNMFNCNMFDLIFGIKGKKIKEIKEIKKIKCFSHDQAQEIPEDFMEVSTLAQGQYWPEDGVRGITGVKNGRSFLCEYLVMCACVLTVALPFLKSFQHDSLCLPLANRNSLKTLPLIFQGQGMCTVRKLTCTCCNMFIWSKMCDGLNICISWKMILDQPSFLPVSMAKYSKEPLLMIDSFLSKEP